MSWIMYVLIVPFAALGMLVNSLGVISLYRFKDVYMRMHGATKCSTLGAIFLRGGGDRLLRGENCRRR